MTTCAFCGSEKTPIYCFGDGQPICHECHTTLPNTIAACRHEIVKLRKFVDAVREAKPVAYMYEHDGMVHTKAHPAILTHVHDRWTPPNEPWTETPLIEVPK